MTAVSPRPPDYRELLEFVQAWTSRNLPGFPLEYLTLQLHRLPVPIQLAGVIAAPSAAPTPATDEQDANDHDPNEYQCRILDALEYKALRSDALIDALGGDRRRLWKPGGIKDLIGWGWVKLDRVKKLGYYRPEAPPAELEGIEQPE